jgi:hypothetical protein
MHYGQCLLAIFRFKICCKDDDSESESAADDDENEEEEDETKGSKREKAVDLNKLYAEILGGIGIEGEEDPVAILDAIEVEGDEEEEGNDSILNEEDEPLPAEDEGAGENDLFAAAAAENGPNDHKKMKKCVETTADEENSDEGTSSESEDENDDAESEESVNDDLDSGVEDEEEAPKSKLLSLARTLFDEAVKICERFGCLIPFCY